MKRFLLLLLVVAGLRAEEITDYFVKIEVQTSGELRIEERITYDFGQTHRHGIYRDIPHTIKGDPVPVDIGLHDFRVLMDGREAVWEKSYISSDAGETVRLRIGDPERTLTGRHRYTISYGVKKGVLPKDADHDAIRWNAVGTGWPVAIHHVVVDCYLPPELSRENTKIATWSGRYGSTSTKATAVWMGPHHLQVAIASLAPHEGLTVEIAYAAGLLKQSGRENTKMGWSGYLLGLWQWPVLGGFLFYLYRFYRRHASSLSGRSVAPMYEPPKGMDVLQAGLILDRVADTEDFAAAVIDLAQKGYLDIFRNDKLSVLQKRKKDPESLSKDERYLLEQILFPEDDVFVLQKESASLREKIREGFSKINEMLYRWSVEQGYLREDPRSVRKVFLIRALGFGIPLFALAVATSVMSVGAAATILLGTISIFVIAGSVIALTATSLMSRIFGALFALLPLFSVGSEILSERGWRILFFTPVPLLLVGVVLVVFIYRHLGRLTPKGADAYRKLMGLKEFIQRVKEDEIRRRLKEDPLYLDKLLPYALLFGLSRHWLVFYKTLDLVPVWYEGDFSRFDTLYRDLHSMGASSSTESGGMSGGGGFSGGGGGGGGGGSW